MPPRETLAEDYGGIDILINNAALIINRPFEGFSLEEYEDQIRVNSSAAFTLARAVAPSMKRKGYGKIVNFCSITLNGRWDGYVPYVTSKGAMLDLTKTLARELGPHGVSTAASRSNPPFYALVAEKLFAGQAESYGWAPLFLYGGRRLPPSALFLSMKVDALRPLKLLRRLATPWPPSLSSSLPEF